MWQRRKFHSALLIPAALSLQTCGFWKSHPIDPIGATLRDGNVVVLVPLCPGQRVSAVEVIQSTDPQIDEKDARLWKISAAEPQAINTIVLGELPQSFREDIALTADFAKDDVLFVEIKGEGDYFLSIDFLVEDLRPDKVWYFNGNLSPREFEGRTACEAR